MLAGADGSCRRAERNWALSELRPKYVTFDCYGTLTWFQIGDVTRKLLAGRVPAGKMDEFLKDFGWYRFDEVLGAWQPYVDVLKASLERTCKRHGIPFVEAEGQAIYEAVPTWGPHPDVAEPLKRVAARIPLVILSNASDDQIHSNVKLLEAPFHTVCTAQQANAYKPRMQAFEYMFDTLGCGPQDVLHVSASYRYDLIPAYGLGIQHKLYINRGYEPEIPYYGAHQATTIEGLAKLLGC
jgi:2-haloacid dehalogenase